MQDVGMLSENYEKQRDEELLDRQERFEAFRLIGIFIRPSLLEKSLREDPREWPEIEKEIPLSTKKITEKFAEFDPKLLPSIEKFLANTADYEQVFFNLDFLIDSFEFISQELSGKIEQPTLTKLIESILDSAESCPRFLQHLADVAYGWRGLLSLKKEGDDPAQQAKALLAGFAHDIGKNACPEQIKFAKSGLVKKMLAGKNLISYLEGGLGNNHTKAKKIVSIFEAIRNKPEILEAIDRGERPEEKALLELGWKILAVDANLTGISPHEKEVFVDGHVELGEKKLTEIGAPKWLIRSTAHHHDFYTDHPDNSFFEKCGVVADSLQAMFSRMADSGSGRFSESSFWVGIIEFLLCSKTQFDPEIFEEVGKLCKPMFAGQSEISILFNNKLRYRLMKHPTREGESYQMALIRRVFHDLKNTLSHPVLQDLCESSMNEIKRTAVMMIVRAFEKQAKDNQQFKLKLTIKINNQNELEICTSNQADETIEMQAIKIVREEEKAWQLIANEIDETRRSLRFSGALPATTVITPPETPRVIVPNPTN